MIADQPVAGAPPAHDIEIVPFEGAPEEWDSLVQGLGESTFCHLYGWRRVLSEVLGHTCHYWLAVDPEGQRVGAMPLVRVRSRLFGDYLLSMPFLSYGGPLGTAAAKSALVERAKVEAERTGVDLVELRNRSSLGGDLAESKRKLTVLLELPSESEEMWSERLRAKVRSQIRRPMKEGMTAEFGPHLAEPFYDVFARTMRDLGTPVLPRAFFDAAARELADHVVFATIDYEGQTVAAGCGFLWESEFEVTWAGALREMGRKAPNMLLYWSLIEESIRRGAHTFNFGRCTEGSGTHRFKRQWGGEDHPLPWAQWSPAGVSSTPSPDSAKYRLATRAWSRLPLSVANRLGPLLARSLP